MTTWRDKLLRRSLKNDLLGNALMLLGWALMWVDPEPWDLPLDRALRDEAP